jgi:hypothetical protein
MKSYRMLALALVALSALLLVVAACKDDKKDDESGGASGQTPSAQETPSTDGGETPEPPPDDTGGEGDGDVASVAAEFSGDVSGEFVMSGMTCDFFPNSDDDGTDDAFSISISGTVGEEQHTLDISAYRAQLTPPAVRLTRTGGDYAKWESTEDGGTESDLVTITETGGQVNFLLPPGEIDPGSASSDVEVVGSWTCPDKMYAPLQQ